jgi:hypothetical protein
MLNILRTEKEFGFKSKASFKEGLIKTIDWYIPIRKKQKSNNITMKKTF